MGKYNDLLIEFMVKKSRIVKQVTGLLIATKPDMDELRSWLEGKCKKVLLALDCNHNCDDKICPWCIDARCECCSYSKRNGVCNIQSTSRYSRILQRIHERTDFILVKHLVGIKELVEKTKKKAFKLDGSKPETPSNPKTPKNV